MRTPLGPTRSVLIRGCPYFSGCLICIRYIWDRTQCLHCSGLCFLRQGNRDQILFVSQTYRHGTLVCTCPCIVERGLWWNLLEFILLMN